MSISDRMQQELNGSSLIRAMFEAAAQARAERGADAVVDLSLGNPMLPPPPEFFASLRELAQSPNQLAHSYNSSNAGLSETRQAIAATLCDECDLPVTADHVIMSCGAAGALNVIFRSLLDAGDEVIILAPYFSEYPYYVGNFGGRVRVVACQADFQPDVSAIRAALTPKTKALILNTPNNPTGEVYAQEVVDRIGETLREHQTRLGRAVYLISDEPYHRLLFDGAQCPSVWKAHDNSLLVRSFSKDLSLAGERIGYIGISPRSGDVTTLARAFTLATRVLGFVNAPSLVQRIIRHCLTARVDVEYYRRNRDILYEALVSSGYRVHKPHGAFYLFPQCPNGHDDVAFCDRLRERGLFTVPGRGFGWPGHFRLSCAVTHETAQRAAQLLAAAGGE